MANKVNKVIDRNGNVLIDLTNDTVSANKVLAGTKFHGPDGKEYTGAIQPNELDTLKYTFIDYDGTVMYQFTDAEIDAMSELPAGPNHTDENLTFQGWNWTLEDLKAVNRNRITRPIVGACLKTTDGKTYITLTTSLDNRSESFCFGKMGYETSGTVSIDWGDGTTDSFTIAANGDSYKSISHTFPQANTEYIISIETTDNMSLGVIDWTYGTGANTNSYGYTVTDIKLGNVRGLGKDSKLMYSRVEKINMPLNALFYQGARYAIDLKALVIPAFSEGQQNTHYGCQYTQHLEIISFPSKIVETNTNYSFQNFFNRSYSLKYLYFPDNVTLTKKRISDAFSELHCLRVLEIPEAMGDGLDLTINKCMSLETLKLPNNISILNIKESGLSRLELPEGMTTLSACSSMYRLGYISIPDSVTSFGSAVFNNSYQQYIKIDLSAQTKVISLTSSLSAYDNSLQTIILVPAALLDQYKSASYWSQYASCMVGV